MKQTHGGFFRAWLEVLRGPLSLFSPAGRRWRKAPDEGGEATLKKKTRAN
jgi:hypothetical protein